MKQSEDKKHSTVLHTLSAELGKSPSRVKRLVSISPNQGVIARYWEIYEEKYPETDIDAHPLDCPDCGSEMSLADTGETITVEYFGLLSE